MEEEHQVSEPLGKAHVVGNHDGGESKLALEPLDEVAEVAGDDGVDHGGGLVVEHDLGLGCKGAGNGHSALAAGREAGRQNIHHILGADQAYQPVHQLQYLVLGQVAALTQREGHVFAHAQGIEERAVLKDHGDSLADAAHTLFVQIGNLLAFDANGALIRLEEAHQHAQGDRLAHAAAAQDAEGLAAIHIEAHVLQNRAAIKRDAHMAEGNQVLRLFGDRFGAPFLLFGGVALVTIAILFDASAYRRREAKAKSKEKVDPTRGIVLSLVAGVLMGTFYPLVAAALRGAKGVSPVGPYAVALFFAVGVLLSTIPANLFLMFKPLDGKPPVKFSGYMPAPLSWHLAGLLGGAIWATGAISNFVASGAHLVGPAVSYSIGQGATMVSACWGVFVWREFADAPKAAHRALLYMFIFFALGLVAVALAPLY